MATLNQIEYLRIVKNYIEEPVLIVGSRMYEYDRYNLEHCLNEMGKTDITGIDINAGPGVNVVADICQLDDPFLKENRSRFKTVLCMEVITNVRYPWTAGENISSLTKKEGRIVVSEAFVRKLSRMPKDYWRFTHDGLSVIYEDFEFDPQFAMKSLIRPKVAGLEPANGRVFQIMHERGPDENRLGFTLRRIHRKFFGEQIFHVSRLLPEQTFYAMGIKK